MHSKFSSTLDGYDTTFSDGVLDLITHEKLELYPEEIVNVNTRVSLDVAIGELGLLYGVNSLVKPCDGTLIIHTSSCSNLIVKLKNFGRCIMRINKGTLVARLSFIRVLN